MNIDTSKNDFQSSLTQLINIYGLDKKCHTFDFLLSKYLRKCIDGFSEHMDELDRLKNIDTTSTEVACSHSQDHPERMKEPDT